MKNQNTSIVTRQPKTHNQLLRNLVEFRRGFPEMLVPIDFSGREPANDLGWKIVDFFYQKGYLTKDFVPTALSIANDFIYLNDGQRVFRSMQYQPKLLCKGKFLLHLDKHYKDEIENFINKHLHDSSNQ